MTNEESFREVAVAETGGLTPAIPVDVAVLRDEIQKTYTDVSVRPEEEFIFPTGRSWAEDLGYPGELLDRVPERTVESFAGVANHFKLGQVNPGETVLDLGCGAGTDLLIAAQMTGPSGRAIGIDMTQAMVERVRESATEMGLENVELHEGMIERVPVPDESVDVVISNGVIDLVPDKDAAFSEIWRVLRGHGRLQIADVTIRNPVSDEGRRNIDLWTGWIAGALLEGEHARLLVQLGFTDIRQGELVDTYSRSAFDDTRRKAEKYGAMGSTIRATKPAGSQQAG